MPSLTLATSFNPGAVAILQLHGPGTAAILRQVTSRNDWPIGRLILADLAGIDRGLAVLLREDFAQLFPHGGPRVVQRLIARLIELGATSDSDVPTRQLFPEAASDLEADMLAALARAVSPAAIDLLLAQPSLWKAFANSPTPFSSNPKFEIRNSKFLLIPPSVVVVGRPNVGKSTLTNQMLGRSASIVADLPGTTRDWVAGIAQIQGVALRWLDTPGSRASSDPIEQQAIELSRQVIASADLLIAMRDPATDWPDTTALPRPVDLWVVNKVDTPGSFPGNSLADSANGSNADHALPISALHAHGVDRLGRLILDKLGLADVSTPRPWAFSPALLALMESGDAAALRVYVGSHGEPRPSGRVFFALE